MDIIKKNILSFICAIVALVALIASFWPMGGQYDELRSQLAERKSVFDKADQLIKKQRPIPTTTVEPTAENAEKETLAYFPSPDVIDKGEAAIEQVRNESLEMFQTVVQLNARPLLVPDSLPELSDVETFEFVRLYKEAINEVIPNDILQAGTPPSQEDIDKEAQELWDKNYAPEEEERQQAGAPAGGNRQGAGRQTGAVRALQEQFNEEVAKLPEQIQNRIANEKKIYIDPLSLDPSKSMDVARPTADQIWYAQVGLWVQEDVARSLAAANAQAKNVLDAPVKRLIKLDVVEQQQSGIVYATDKSIGGRTGGGRGAGGAMPGMPGMMPGMMGGGYSEPAAPAATDGKISKDFTVSPTGRVSSTANPLYDVVHFKLDLVVDAARIAQVLQELQRNKLVTVLRMDELASIDAAVDQAEGYIYGDQPVVRISLLCEALFLREWTLPLMPQRVRQDLGIQQTTSGAEATAAANVR